MKSVPFLLFALALGILIVWLPLGCGDDEDDDDDDDSISYGQDISGVYPVVMTVEDDTCAEENLGDAEDWIITIEQSGDFSWAEIYWQTAGVGSEKILLFEAKVYGTVIVKAGVEEIPLGQSECVKFVVQNYYIYVDLAEGILTGRLTDDIFYQGGGCDTSSIDCRFERIISPQIEAGD